MATYASGSGTITNNSLTATNTTEITQTTGTIASQTINVTCSEYRGFYAWRVKSAPTGGNVYRNSDETGAITTGAIINAETPIYFVPTNNDTKMGLELEALWAQAYVTTSNTTTGMNNSVSYERNFMVLASGGNSNPSTGCSYTVMSIYPNGTYDGTNGANTNDIETLTLNDDLTLSSDVKFENINVSGGSRTITVNDNYLVFGRGISTNNTAANIVRGVSSNGYRTPKMRIESGKINSFYLICSGTTTYTSGTVSGKVTFGCDFDRARKNNNNMLVATSNNTAVYGAYALHVNSETNRNNLTYDWILKSGQFLDSSALGYGGGGEESIYMSSTGSNNYYNGKHNLLMEGGVVSSIAGGMDGYGSNSGYTATIRIKGGHICGAIYGAAEFADAAGDRKFVITGGIIDGWIAGGCNGTATTGGGLDGDSHIYIGGNAKVGKANTFIGQQNFHNDNQGTYGDNGSYGGNVYGAGCGIRPHGNNNYTNFYFQNGFKYNTVGQTNNTKIALSDNAEILYNVYGGGNYGSVASGGSSELYIGGDVIIRGSVFGGSNMQKGQGVTINMYDGQVIGGIYGGSNRWGYINEDININIYGGTIGDPENNIVGSVFGGGYGDSTITVKNINIVIGKSSNHEGPIVYGDVYGGSAMGTVNGGTATDNNTGNTTTRTVNLTAAYSENQHTFVTIHGGNITGRNDVSVGTGSVYGGGLGTASYAANVYAGTVKVTVNGGTMNRTFGANNANGLPYGSVETEITGGTIGNVYGGGNAAAYGNQTNNDVPTVTMTGGTVLHDVFGGGLGANARVTRDTRVDIKGTSVVNGNVFGGGSEAEVGASGNSHNTLVNILGSARVDGNVYGGGNRAKVWGNTVVNVGE